MESGRSSLWFSGPRMAGVPSFNIRWSSRISASSDGSMVIGSLSIFPSLVGKFTVPKPGYHSLDAINEINEANESNFCVILFWDYFGGLRYHRLNILTH